MTHDLVERLRDYGLTLEESVVICDRRVVDEAADLIESLRADLAEQKAAHGDCIKRNIALTAEIAALRAEKDELRKALEPFAKLAGRFMDETSQRLKPDDHNVWGYGDETLTYGDFRRAAAIHQMGERP
ncbi:hypothetical protein AKG11_32740 [Shinella sp. SUS2]|uniref:hypothetical protein n=1 Tax=unclassified Shinella TaxID=2643062 RepID=UPI000682C00B|nr:MULTISPECIES: hypothetical protein [unclassified Shinella]KNY11869.1 hypothetical protein AKG11_32740 [Shinella sp. SUS2]KOC71549.1 hypothetical protein AKG10_32405 [Shinella sp. GWS1]